MRVRGATRLPVVGIVEPYFRRNSQPMLEYEPPALPLIKAPMSTIEKRREERRPYVCQQLVADYDGKTMPAKEDFYLVTFRDISATGAAFLSPRKPARDKVVIVLGKGEIHVTARVVRAFYRTDLPEMPYEVGCEFERRLH